MIFKKTLSFVLLLSFITPNFGWAVTSAEIDLQDLALPTEVKDLGKTSGAVYYSATTKNKTLMPVHFWGEVGRPGLHFIPLDSRLVKGLSFAGGGSSSANLEEVIVNRMEGGKVKRHEFNLAEGGDIKAHEYMLKPGDTVFVEKDRFFENRAYYTSLITLGVTILSGFLILKRLEEKTQ